MRLGKNYEAGRDYVKKYFAIIPVTIGRDTRWLEWVKVKGYYTVGWSGRWWWMKKEFVD